MIYFKSGYYIDELNRYLSKRIGEDVLEKFYKDSLPFCVDELPTQIDVSEVNPLLKVVWNIITRGRPTRASLGLAAHILKTHLGDERVSLNFELAEAKIEYSWPELAEIDPGLLKDLLENFANYTEEKVAERLGVQCLTLYRILSDLQSASKLHQLILLLYIIYSPSGKFDVDIKGIHNRLANFIVQDLNELIGNLNSLVADSEVPVNAISFNKTKKPHVVLINDASGNGFSIRSLSSVETKETEEEDYLQKVLTDRRIVYKQLGTLHEQEVDDKYVQNFEYSSPDQHYAMQYILRNLFRKCDFRSGQESIINRALVDKDVIGLLPTGGGKSLTYQICGLLQPGVSIVIEPINSLMKDQYDGLISNGISNAVFINSFNTMEEREEYLSNLIKSRYQFVYISPERLQIQKFRSHLEECAAYGVYYSFAVIDEAHCVSEWGHDFRHTYLNLAYNLKRFCKSKEKELIFFGLTATASFDVLADVQRELDMAEDTIITLPADAIDRKELNFNILKIEKNLSEEVVESFYQRENEIGMEKYPILKKSIERIPDELKRISGKTQIIDLGNNFFGQNKDGEYENAGVIFCPTKSNTLSNGVLSLKDFLEVRCGYLDIGTFFGGFIS